MKNFTHPVKALLLVCLLLLTTGAFSQTADFNIQHLQDDIGVSGGTNTSFTSVSSTNNAFAIANNNRKVTAGPSSSTGNMEADDLSGARVLTNSNTLTYYRQSGSSTANMGFNSSIWEYVGPTGGNNEMIVRGRYVVTLNGTTNSVTQNISGISNAEKCIPFITGILTDVGTDGADSATAVAYLENATTMRVEKGTNANNVRVYITLVEFTGNNWTVLHGDSGNTSNNTGAITLRNNSDGTGTATNVSNWSEAVIFGHHRGDNNVSGTNQAIADNWPIMDPGSNNQTVDWTFNANHDSNGTNRHFVHVLTNPNLNVTRYQNASNATGETTIDITSAGLTNVNEALIIGSSISSGGGMAYARGWRNYYFNSSTQAAHMSHRNGNTMSHEIQIVDLYGLRSNTSSCFTISSFPYNEGFETGLGNWTQDTGDSEDWTRQSGGTPSGQTGPSGAHEGSHYMFTEASSPNFNYVFNLDSPCIDLTSETFAEFSFYYHMYGADMGVLDLEVSTDGGTTFSAPLWSQIGGVQTTQTDAWLQATVDLSAYLGQVIQIRFNGTTGSNYRSDMAIDDIYLNTTPSPDIDIVDSGSTAISDGSTDSPSLLNNTEFGSVSVGSSTAQTYTIENNGAANLTLSSWTSSNGDFTITAPGLTTIPAGSSTTFDVTFNPSSAGVITSTITINNNDNAPEDVYTFTVSGTGLTPLSCSSTVISFPYSESFETGLGGWSSGGSDAIRLNNATYAYDNNHSLNIRANSGNGSTFCGPLMPISTFDKVDFEFFFYADGFESGETFTVEFSNNDGATWQVVRTFRAGNTAPSSKTGDFQLGSTSTDFYVRTATILATNYTFTNNSRFRIQAQASDTTDNIYIDNISITGVTYSTPTVGPGGVTSGLSLWLQADKLDGTNVGTDASLVSQWIDTGIGNDAKVAGAGNEPTYRNSPGRNINFNPVIDFTNNNATASGDMTYLDGREVLFGTAGFNSNDIFMVVMPDVTVTTSIVPLDTFTGFDVTANNTYNEDVTGFGYGNYTARLSGEIFAYAIGSTSGSSPYPGYGRGVTDTSLNLNQISIINTRHNTSDTDMEIYLNANQIGSTTNDAADFSTVREQKFWIGRSQYWQGSFDGRIAEIITYTARKNDVDATQERNRIQSYLGIKYGITLEPTVTAGVILEGNLDYVDSDGTVIWDVSANSSYNFDIAGIGRDDASGLDQRQSSSVNSIVDGTGETRGIITMGLTSIESTNSQNKSINATGFNDKNFLMWGSNNASLDAAPSTINVDMSAGISGLNTNVSFIGMQRIWKVVETGSVERVQVSIPQNAVRNISPPGSYLMFISDTGVFTPTAEYRVMYADGSGNLLADYDFNGTKFITFGYAPEVIVERSIQFVSGNQNFIDMEDSFDLIDSYTLSAWVKRGSSSANTSIISKRDFGYSNGYDLKVDALGRVEMSWKNGSTNTLTSSVALTVDVWHHVAIICDSDSGRTTIYIDGVEDTHIDGAGVPGDTDNFFLVGAAGKGLNIEAYYDGNVDEVRIWNTAITESELRYLMNQELENNPGTIGKYFDDNAILPTKNDASGLDFSNLRGYFPMSRYTYTNTNDESGNNIIGYLRQLTTVDFQTAPLPYISNQDGNWENAATWVNGSSQTIPGARSLVNNDISVDWNIIQTGHNITIDNTSLFDDDIVNVNDPDGNDNEGNRTVLAHILDAGEVTVSGDVVAKTGYGYTVSHYFELNGKIDLEGESQLIQTTDSDLVVGPSGELERDQQGTTNTFHYNYWSAPIGITSTTPSDPVNVNRYSYTVTDVMRDGLSSVNFSNSGYDGAPTTPVTIADYWIWKFANNTDGDYSQWEHVRRTGTILPGEGFTMKGPGTSGSEQNYTFLGKPNNADINLTISQYNDYLVGNPYASAIDADQFIIDNGPTIYYDDSVTPEADATTSGTLYFWEHWGGTNHVLAQYQGGYATYNLAGSASAPYGLLGTNDPDVGPGGTPTKVPGRYIPVGQGFFVVASNGGTINFNNGQRVFKKEATGTSIFVRSTQAQEISSESEGDPRQKIKIGFDSVGDQHRQLLLTIDDRTTPGHDWGYDGKTYNFLDDDIFWLIDNNLYVIQASNSMDEDTSYPLAISMSQDGNNIIMIDELINISEDQDVFLHDKDLGLYHNLKESDYEIFLNTGYYDSRFEIVFADRSQSLSNDDFKNSEHIDVLYANSIDKVVLINPHSMDISAIEIYNMLGQQITKITEIKNGIQTEYNVGDLSSGAYIIKLNTASGSVSKKVLID